VSTAGYSGTPLPRKLGIRDGSRVVLVGAPADFAVTLGDLPPGVELLRPGVGDVDVALLFALDLATLRSRFAPLAAALQPAGGLWVAWPKRSSGIATELSDSAVRELGLAAGLVDNKVCAIDATWSGLRFVWQACATGREPSRHRSSSQRLKTPTRAAAPAITAITATATATTRSSRSGGSSTPERIASSTRCQRLKPMVAAAKPRPIGTTATPACSHLGLMSATVPAVVPAATSASATRIQESSVRSFASLKRGSGGSGTGPS